MGVRALARRPQDEAAGLRVRRGERGARLHRHGGEALVDEARADAHLGVLERLLAGRAGGGEVAALGKSFGASSSSALARSISDVERVVVDVDELGGVDGLRARLGDDTATGSPMKRTVSVASTGRRISSGVATGGPAVANGSRFRSAAV